MSFVLQVFGTTVEGSFGDAVNIEEPQLRDIHKIATETPANIRRDRSTVIKDFFDKKSPLSEEDREVALHSAEILNTTKRVDEYQISTDENGRTTMTTLSHVVGTVQEVGDKTYYIQEDDKGDTYKFLKEDTTIVHPSRGAMLEHFGRKYLGEEGFSFDVTFASQISNNLEVASTQEA